MYGSTPSCLFVVFSNPDDDHREDVDRWYMEVHGPDALRNGSFTALHRYRAAGHLGATNLALWEGDYRTVAEARDYIVPRATGLHQEGRVTTDLRPVWSALHFLGDAAVAAAAADVRTLTVIESSGGPAPSVPDAGSSRYDYGAMTLVESGGPPGEVAGLYAGVGESGLAPHGPRRGVFSESGEGADSAVGFEGVWVSHWTPIASLTLADL